MDAANTGTATRKAAWVGVRVSCLEMKGARGPNMTQVVKPVSKYRKQAIRAFQLPLFRESINSFMTSFLGGALQIKTPPTLRMLGHEWSWRRCLWGSWMQWVCHGVGRQWWQ